MKAPKGEGTFDSKKQKVHVFENKPLPVAEYGGKLVTGWEVAKSDGQGKLPYVRGKVEGLKTAAKKGGKNRMIFHNFFLNTTPNENGRAQVNAQDGIVALCNAMGKSFKCPVISAKKMNAETEKLETVKILDPAKVVKLLEGMVGPTFKFRSKNEKGFKPGDETLWPKVDRFIAKAGEDESEEEDEEDEDEEEGDDEDEDESEDDESEDEDEDDDSDDEDDDDEEEDSDEDEDEDSDDEDEEEDDDDEDSDDEEAEDDEDEDEEEVKPKKKAKKKIVKKKGKK